MVSTGFFPQSRGDPWKWGNCFAKAYLHSLKPALHVIARSEATRQSVLLAVGRREKQYFGRIRRWYGFARTIACLPGFPAGMRIATPRRYKLRILRPGFSGEKPGLSHSAASPSPGRTSAPRFPFLHWFAMTCRGRERAWTFGAGVRRRWRRVSGGKAVGRKDRPPHCHCEERSDGAIRILCGRAGLGRQLNP